VSFINCGAYVSHPECGFIGLACLIRRTYGKTGYMLYGNETDTSLWLCPVVTLCVADTEKQ
jgi:hypothetical protein